MLTHAQLGTQTDHKVNARADNNAATGMPTITGTARVVQELTAALGPIADGRTNVRYT